MGSGLGVVSTASTLYTTVAITHTGALKGWGASVYGILGYGPSGFVGDSAGEMGNNTPSIGLGSGRYPVQISGGDLFFCALMDIGLVKCWGNNTSYQLGLGDSVHRGDHANELDDYLPYVSLW